MGGWEEEEESLLLLSYYTCVRSSPYLLAYLFPLGTFSIPYPAFVFPYTIHPILLFGWVGGWEEGLPSYLSPLGTSSIPYPAFLPCGWVGGWVEEKKGGLRYCWGIGRWVGGLGGWVGTLRLRRMCLDRIRLCGR